MGKKVDFGSWWDLAACQWEDPDLFFPVSHIGPARTQLKQAKAVCAGCSVRQRCLDYATATHQVHGVWGGLSEQERGALQVTLPDRKLDRASA